jgi:hypothetical protein
MKMPQSPPQLAAGDSTPLQSRTGRGLVAPSPPFILVPPRPPRDRRRQLEAGESPAFPWFPDNQAAQVFAYTAFDCTARTSAFIPRRTFLFTPRQPPRSELRVCFTHPADLPR